MRRTSLTSAIAICAAAMLAPFTAAAGTDDDSARERLRDAAHDLEPLRLECVARTTDDRAAVHCEWSQPTWRIAHSVRLYRFDPAVDPHRQLVFRTTELAQTSFVDTHVRPGHGYAYVVVALDDHGRAVGRSRTEWVRVPGADDGSDVEILGLGCALVRSREVIGCRWTRPTSRDAAVVNLWRSVDDGPRELVEQFRPNGPSEHLDRIPARSHEVTYSVTASSASDRVVARSRPVTVRIPPQADRPVDTPPAVVRPTTVPPPVPTDDRAAVRSGGGGAP